MPTENQPERTFIVLSLKHTRPRHKAITLWRPNDIDHMPSQRALAAFLNASYPQLSERQIQAILRKAPSIAIPRKVHQKYSETYGGRNTKVQQAKDASDLRSAVDTNLNAIKPYLLDEGFTEDQVESARSDLHNLHQQEGWY